MFPFILNEGRPTVNLACMHTLNMNIEATMHGEVPTIIGPG